MLVLNVRLKEAKLGSVRLAPCRKLIAARVDFGRANREDIAESARAGVGHILEFESARNFGIPHHDGQRHGKSDRTRVRSGVKRSDSKSR
jgi:hypothetical protein